MSRIEKLFFQFFFIKYNNRSLIPGSHFHWWCSMHPDRSSFRVIILCKLNNMQTMEIEKIRLLVENRWTEILELHWVLDAFSVHLMIFKLCDIYAQFFMVFTETLLHSDTQNSFLCVAAWPRTLVTLIAFFIYHVVHDWFSRPKLWIKIYKLKWMKGFLCMILHEWEKK